MTVHLGIREGQLQVNSLREHSILTALNSDVHLLNNLATDMLTGDAREYTAVDESLDGTVTTENMNRKDPIEVGPFRLRLKIGQPIILLRNMNPRRHLCNGTRLTVRGLHNKFIEADILLDKEVPPAYHTVMIPRIPLDVSEDSSCPFRFRRIQFLSSLPSP